MREAGRADSQSYLLRIRGFYGGLRAGIVSHLSPEQEWRALLLERDQGNLKARVAVAAPDVGDGREACITPICSPSLIQGLGDAVKPNKPNPEQSSLFPRSRPTAFSSPSA